MPDGVWALKVTRLLARYGVGMNRPLQGPMIIQQLPTRIVTSITPAHFLSDVFEWSFDSSPVWPEVERRFGPRGAVSKEERERIREEISAPVRSWIVGMGIPNRVKAEVLRRERGPLIERWLEGVVVI
jgi:hypothetical protein